MSRDPIDTAKQVWNTLNRGLDRALLVIIVVGMIAIPVLAVLDALGVVALFSSPRLWNLTVVAIMVVIGGCAAWTWLHQKIAAARRLELDEEQR